MSANGETEPAEATIGGTIPAWIGWALAGVPLFGAAVLFVAVAFVGGPGLYRSVTADECGALPAERAELLAARQEHLAIVSVARNCPGEAQTIAAAVAAQPFAALESCQMFSDSVRPDMARAALPGYLDATLYLSKAIAAARAKLAGKAVTDHLLSGLFEWTIVVTGLFTTILISIKAFANPRSGGYLPMAVMAIVLSSLGTAVATLNSFYTPRIEYEKTERSLASLRNLHWTMAGELLRAKNACGQKGDWSSWRPRHVRDLENTFAAIMATSMRPTGDPANANDAPDDEPTSPPKAPPGREASLAPRPPD